MATTLPTNLQSAVLVPQKTHLSQKVQTLLTHLRAIGRPTPATELVARCRESGLSIELIEFICSVPGSPIRLNDDGFVTYLAVEGSEKRFRVCIGLENEGIGGVSLRIESGKRKGDDLKELEFMPARRKARLLYCNDDDKDDDDFVSLMRARRVQSKVIPLPAVYIRKSARKHGGKAIASSSSDASGKLTNNNETLLLDSNVGFSRHVENAMPCFQDNKACANTTDPAVSASPKVGILNKVHLPLIKDKMMENESCMNVTNGAVVLSSFSGTDEADNGDPHLGNLENPFAGLAFPREMYKMSSPSDACQFVPLDDLHDMKISIDHTVPEGLKTASSVFLKTAKESSQIGESQSWLMKEQKVRRREIQDIQPRGEDHGFSNRRKLFCEKIKTCHKSKLPSERQNLLMPAMKSLPKTTFTIQEASKTDVPAATVHKILNETKNAVAHMDRAKEIADPKTYSEQNLLPTFESFIVEEEEGSGGYGTVFKARRKSDSEIVAIKCPHPNAPRNHVYNELSMLQRFGGKNFIIRLEDSFKYENSRCFVLEHVVHDRPEVLKKEIDISQLQWYAYCMFEALANLHKHGVVHRDVKPGNFLFSREVNIGYLIDFNLAMDLHQKNGPLKRPRIDSDLKASQTLVSTAKNKDTVGRGIERASIADSKNQKGAASRTKTSTSFCKGKPSSNKSQVALDGSGVTSTKGVTSSKTRRVERMQQPMPSNGRKEILKLAQEAMQAPKHKAVNVPTMKSKRILAPPQKIDRKPSCFTPMPLQSSGVAVVTAGFLSHKGDEKKQKEGPCAGTKGFRAPEVLFRSLHQGPKMDVWSAGVTFLYLLIGRTPFYGDINENIKAIAKLRGSEDLWEVAKLHNQESAFPVELLDVKYLPSMKLREWCQLNSKRPSFIKEAPDALFDFLDKCLTVNPRLRISAEEALQHKFLTPCRDMLLQQALLSSPTI